MQNSSARDVWMLPKILLEATGLRKPRGDATVTGSGRWLATYCDDGWRVGAVGSKNSICPGIP